MSQVLSRCIIDTNRALVVNGALDRPPDISATVRKEPGNLRKAWQIYDREVLVRVRDLQRWTKFRIIYHAKVEDLAQFILVRMKNVPVQIQCTNRRTDWKVRCR